MTCLGGDHLSQAVSYWKQDLSVVQPCKLKFRLAIIHQLHWGMLTPSVSCRGSPESGPRPQYEGDIKSILQIIFFPLLSSSHAFLKLTEKQLCVHTSSLEPVLFCWVLMLHSFVLHTISTRTFCPPGFIRQSITSTPLHPRLSLVA